MGPISVDKTTKVRIDMRLPLNMLPVLPWLLTLMSNVVEWFGKGFSNLFQCTAKRTANRKDARNDGLNNGKGGVVTIT